MNHISTKSLNRYLIVNLWDIFYAETEEKPSEKEEYEHNHSVCTNLEDVVVTYKGEKLLADEYAVFSVLLDTDSQGITAKDLLVKLKWPDGPDSYKRLGKSLRKLGQGKICFERKGRQGGFTIISILSDLSWGSETEKVCFSIDERLDTLFNNGRITLLEAFYHMPSIE